MGGKLTPSLSPHRPPTRSQPQLEAELQGLKRLIVSSGTPLGAGAGAAAVTPAAAATRLSFDADSGEEGSGGAKTPCMHAGGSPREHGPSGSG